MGSGDTSEYVPIDTDINSFISPMDDSSAGHGERKFGGYITAGAVDAYGLDVASFSSGNACPIRISMIYPDHAPFRLSGKSVRRYVLGSQGLWPGRRWDGIDGVRAALGGFRRSHAPGVFPANSLITRPPCRVCVDGRHGPGRRMTT